MAAACSFTWWLGASSGFLDLLPGFLFGGSHTVYHTAEATISDSSGGTAQVTAILCKDLTYDTTSAPEDGC